MFFKIVFKILCLQNNLVLLGENYVNILMQTWVSNGCLKSDYKIAEMIIILIV